MQGLFDFAMLTGTKCIKSDAAQKGEGANASGHKHETTTAVLDRHGFTVEAARLDWQKFDPSASRTGQILTLTIKKDDKTIFLAMRHCAVMCKKSGTEHSFAGTENTPAGVWVNGESEIPERLQTVPA